MNPRIFSGITRREWAVLLTSAQLAAQARSRSRRHGAVPPPQRPIRPEQGLPKAQTSVQDVSARLSQMDVPMNVEPAFAFRP